jgi:hypothetical protein
MPDPSREDDRVLPLVYADIQAEAERNSGRWLRLNAILALASVFIAILGFPLGALTSIFLELHPNLVSNSTAQRMGFMLFAILEGLAAACGLLAVLRTRWWKNNIYRTAVAGTVLGALGSVIVLLMIYWRAIR